MIVALAVDALAFSIGTPFSPPIHEQITAECLIEAGYEADRWAARSVRIPDWSEAFHPKRYAGAHHCDRNPGQTDEEALTACFEYYAERRGELLGLIHEAAQGEVRRGRLRKAARPVLGAIFHAQEDFWSHSDASHGEFEPAVAGWSTGEPGMPVYRIAWYSPENVPWSDETGGDAYPHALYSHDTPESCVRCESPAEAYGRARQLAIETCVATLKDLHRLCVAQNGAACEPVWSMMFRSSDVD